MSWASAPAFVFRGTVAVFLFYGVVFVYLVQFLSELDRLIPSMFSVYTAAENRSDLFLYEEVTAGCKSGPPQIPSFTTLRHFCLRRSWSNDTENLRNGLRKYCKLQKKTTSRKTKFFHLWPFLAMTTERVVENYVVLVLEQRVRYKLNHFIDLW